MLNLFTNQQRNTPSLCSLEYWEVISQQRIFALLALSSFVGSCFPCTLFFGTSLNIFPGSAYLKITFDMLWKESDFVINFHKDTTGLWSPRFFVRGRTKGPVVFPKNSDRSPTKFWVEGARKSFSTRNPWFLCCLVVTGKSKRYAVMSILPT